VKGITSMFIDQRIANRKPYHDKYKRERKKKVHDIASKECGTPPYLSHKPVKTMVAPRYKYYWWGSMWVCSRKRICQCLSRYARQPIHTHGPQPLAFSKGKYGLIILKWHPPHVINTTPQHTHVLCSIIQSYPPYVAARHVPAYAPQTASHPAKQW